MSTVKAIIFDSDGTLLNAFEFFVGAYVHIAQVHGLPIPDPMELRDKMARAVPLHTILEEIFPGTDVELLLDTNREFVTKNLIDIQGYEGLHEMLASLHGQGYRLGIFTGSDEAVVDIYKHHNIEQLFSSIVHIRRTTQHKPHPEGLLLAAKECGATPAETIMVGDSRNDILAGKNAGCKATIGITHGNDSRENLEAAGADYIIDSLIDLPALIDSIE